MSSPNWMPFISWWFTMTSPCTYSSIAFSLFCSLPSFCFLPPYLVLFFQYPYFAPSSSFLGYCSMTSRLLQHLLSSWSALLVIISLSPFERSNRYAASTTTTKLFLRQWRVKYWKLLRYRDRARGKVKERLLKKKWKNAFDFKQYRTPNPQCRTPDFYRKYKTPTPIIQTQEG